MNHIAMLIPTIDEIGGAERQVLLLAKALSARGWQVTIVALSGSGTGAAIELDEAGVDYLSLGMRKAWFDPRGWCRYLAWAARNRPDIVHAHLPHATWFARWVRLLAPVRIHVDTIHTSKAGRIGRRFGYRFSDRLSNQITCVSNSVASSVITAGIAQKEKPTVLPNGVVMPQPSDSSDRQLNASRSQPFRWLAIGRLAPVKDYPTLLHAFAKLPGEPSLQIVGSGPEEQSLQRLAVTLRIESRVQFAGFHSDVQPFLARADCFVLSSLWEGLPMGVLEASAAGLPVVATDGNGTREAIIPGKTGLLVPVADAEALSEAMSAVMAMPLNSRLEMGAHGRQWIEENFSLTIVVDRWEKLYLHLLGEHPRPSRIH
jgi:glycosyltransferase involved in cell wall biosynthesis